MCRKGIITVVPERFVRSHNEEIADGWMVGNLLAVDFSAVWVFALEGLADYWV